jgi:hypothetical protein
MPFQLYSYVALVILNGEFGRIRKESTMACRVAILEGQETHQNTNAKTGFLFFGIKPGTFRIQSSFCPMTAVLYWAHGCSF